MSAEIQIDDDKITVLRDKVAKKADKMKEEYLELVNLHNQLNAIQKNKNGEVAVSKLTKQPLSDKLRKIIYEECLQACARLKIS